MGLYKNYSKIKDVQQIMGRYKEKLAAAGAIGGFSVFYIIAYLFTFYPLAILGLQWWADVLIIVAILFLGSLLGGMVSTGIWIWGLVVTINGVQDGWAILFYVIFVIHIIIFVSRIIRAFKSK